jgi:hydrogenase expression/formation protein HypE
MSKIVQAHGGGGEMTKRLLEEHVLPPLSNALLDPLFDSAVLPPVKGRICLTTDAFVVQPLTFPGGDIGRLAVCGTVNDLAVMGAKPLALSLALVMEEGLPVKDLDRYIASIARASNEAGVPVATGDTKVVERGRGDGLMITTAGIGEIREGVELGPSRIAPGDGILVTGLIAEHGLAVMSAREGFNIKTRIESDAAPLNSLVEVLLQGDVKFLRDATRGGVAGVLADLVEDTSLGIEVREEALPLSSAVRHTAELLGLDPLTVANEGKIVAVVGEGDMDRVLAACRAHPLGRNAALIGRMTAGDLPLAELITTIGGRRIIQRPYGEELPRIC